MTSIVDKIFDIFVAGAILLMGLAALYFRKSNILRSRGYLFYGISCLLAALTLLLFKFRVSLYAIFIILAFVILQIGNVILMTKEKHIYDVYRRHPGIFRRLLSGFYPNRDIQNNLDTEAEKGAKPKKTNGKQAIFTGLIFVLAGIVAFFWRKEMIYPAFLTGTGILFIVVGSLYGIRKQEKPN